METPEPKPKEARILTDELLGGQTKILAGGKKQIEALSYDLNLFEFIN